MITADDGYQDNLTRMLPLLEKYGYKAVVYVVTGEGYNRWDVEHASNPDTRVDLMNGEQLKALTASGHVEIGGHTLTHPRLSKLAPEQQAHEIKRTNDNSKPCSATLCCRSPTLMGIWMRVQRRRRWRRVTVLLLPPTAGPEPCTRTLSDPPHCHFPAYDVLLWRKIRGNYVFRKS
jgi:peptidoglycan/xylan/chitin deacetylase (PgdA/CDA1 family)